MYLTEEQHLAEMRKPLDPWRRITWSKNIKVTKDFITEEDAQAFIDWIDNNIHKFNDYKVQKNPNRLALRFGRDQVFWDTTHHSTELMDGIEPLARKYFDLVCSKLQELYDDPNKLYVASFWLAKQKAGSFITPHFDAMEETNKHFKHSGIIYLNGMESGGDLLFPKLMVSIKPEGRELVTFPSQSTVDQEYLHEVLEISNDRYSILFWVTEQEYFAV